MFEFVKSKVMEPCLSKAGIGLKDWEAVFLLLGDGWYSCVEGWLLTRKQARFDRPVLIW